MRNIFKRFEFDFVFITFATFINALLLFIFSTYARTFIMPHEYGIFSTCSLLTLYLGYAQLGILNSYNRDYPQLLGRGMYEEAKEIQDNTFSFILVFYSLLFIIIIFVVYILKKRDTIDLNYSKGYLFAGLISFLSIIDLFIISTAKINKKFNLVGFSIIIKSIIGVGLGLILVKSINFVVLYVPAIVSVIISILFFYKTVLSKFTLRLNYKLIKDRIFEGFPLLINSLIWTFVSSIDKFVILFFLTTTALGNYSIATLAFGTIILIPSTISSVFYIKLNLFYGVEQDEHKLFSLTSKYSLYLSLLTSIVSVISFYLLPLFVNHFISDYKEGVQAARILTIGVSIYASTILYGNIFTILKKTKLLITNSVSLAIFNLVFSVVLVYFNRSINFVAIGTSLSYFAYSVMLMIRLKNIFGVSIIRIIKVSWLPIFLFYTPSMIIYLIK